MGGYSWLQCSDQVTTRQRTERHCITVRLLFPCTLLLLLALSVEATSSKPATRIGWLSRKRHVETAVDDEENGFGCELPLSMVTDQRKTSRRATEPTISTTTFVRGGETMGGLRSDPGIMSGARYGGSFPSTSGDDTRYPYRSSPRNSPYGGRSSWSSYPRINESRGSFNKRTRNFFQPFTDWWTINVSPNIKNWPKIHCRVEPTTTLKIRKTFRPLHTIVQVGADFNTQLSVWQFKSSWEDALIGGKLTLAGRELQFTKSWQLSVGAMGDLVTRLKLRAAVDLQTWKAYARIGFRTERLAPINVMEGFTVMKQIPLDGNKGHVKLEVKANFALPEPEIEYSTEIQRSVIGMGDIEINIDELNLLLDY